MRSDPSRTAAAGKRTATGSGHTVREVKTSSASIPMSELFRGIGSGLTGGMKVQQCILPQTQGQ
jgi:hypothetical protein